MSDSKPLTGKERILTLAEEKLFKELMAEKPKPRKSIGWKNIFHVKDGGRFYGKMLHPSRAAAKAVADTDMRIIKSKPLAQRYGWLPIFFFRGGDLLYIKQVEIMEGDE